jgi:hypothetical protein
MAANGARQWLVVWVQVKYTCVDVTVTKPKLSSSARCHTSNAGRLCVMLAGWAASC